MIASLVARDLARTAHRGNWHTAAGRQCGAFGHGDFLGVAAEVPVPGKHLARKQHRRCDDG